MSDEKPQSPTRWKIEGGLMTITLDLARIETATAVGTMDIMKDIIKRVYQEAAEKQSRNRIVVPGVSKITDIFKKLTGAAKA